MLILYLIIISQTRKQIVALGSKYFIEEFSTVKIEFGSRRVDLGLIICNKNFQFHFELRSIPLLIEGQLFYTGCLEIPIMNFYGLQRGLSR